MNCNANEKIVNGDLPWGTNGINGTEPLKWKKLRDLDSSHLNNILACCGYYISDLYKQTIYSILKERGVNAVVDISDAESRVIHEAYTTKAMLFARNKVI